MDLKNLINYLPSYYKDKDTYKVDDKGILERFLEICGTYLEDIVAHDIESVLEDIDINNMPSYNLNYIWEFLGELPFAYSAIVNKDNWDLYYDPFDSDEQKAEKSKLWEVVKDSVIKLDDTQVRNILKYAISLYKIRGTKRFFETLFRMYGIVCTISDPYSTATYDNGNMENTMNSWLNIDTRLDSVELDSVTLDNFISCDQCVTVDVDISDLLFAGNEVGNRYFRDINEVYIAGKAMNTNEVLQEIEQYNNGEEARNFCVFRRAIENLFDRFLPFNCKANITYRGVKPDDKYQVTIELNPESPSTTYEVNSPSEVWYNIEITSRGTTDKRYQVGVYGDDDDIHWGNVTTDSIIVLTAPELYVVRALGDSENLISLPNNSIHRVITQIIFEIEPIDDGVIKPSNIGVGSPYKLTCYKVEHHRYLRNRWDVSTVLQVTDSLTGMTYIQSSVEEPLDILLDAGIHHFYITSNNLYFKDIEVVKEERHFYFEAFRTEGDLINGNVWDNPQLNITPDTYQYSIWLNVYDQYLLYEYQHSQYYIEGRSIYEYLLNTNKLLKFKGNNNYLRTYTGGSEVTLINEGSYTFYCIEDIDKEYPFKLALRPGSLYKWVLNSYREPSDIPEGASTSYVVRMSSRMVLTNRLLTFTEISNIRNGGTNIEIDSEGNPNINTDVAKVLVKVYFNSTNQFFYIKPYIFNPSECLVDLTISIVNGNPVVKYLTDNPNSGYVNVNKFYILEKLENGITLNEYDVNTDPSKWFILFGNGNRFGAGLWGFGSYQNLEDGYLNYRYVDKNSSEYYTGLYITATDPKSECWNKLRDYNGVIYDSWKNASNIVEVNYEYDGDEYPGIKVNYSYLGNVVRGTWYLDKVNCEYHQDTNQWECTRVIEKNYRVIDGTSDAGYIFVSEDISDVDIDNHYRIRFSNSEGFIHIHNVSLPTDSINDDTI